MSGTKAVFYFRLAPAQPKRSSATQTFYILEETKMKNNMMKKFLTMTLACAMTLSLAACGSKAEPSADQSTAAPIETDTKAYKVAIIKQLDHASLDEIANAVTAELDQISADKNVKIEYEVTSGQGDQTILKQLSDQAIADGVDAIIPIATTAAQIAALSAEEAKTPVVYAAVSDPETAKLTGIDYVTGTSDALNTDFIMDMMFAQNPSVAKVGLLYSLSEPNSAKPIADAKAYLDTKGIEYVEQTANTNDEVVAAASALIAAGVDAVFTPTDNVIMAAELAIYEDLAKNGIPHYTGADSFVRNGAYATCGVNYTDLGTQTADLAYKAITEGMDGMEDYYLMDGGIITVNTDTCALIGKQADYACFDSMGEVVEVTTTKD
jgi:putative ABC transport system substrate-binding protein